MRIGSLISCLFAVLAGCATSYQSSGLTGGHYKTPAPWPLEKVTFSGNGYIDADTVRQYALFRCAEIAKEKKKPYFLIFDSLNAAAVGRPVSQPNVGKVGNKPIAVAYMLVLDAPQSGALETDKTLGELEDLIKKNRVAP